MLKTRKAWFVVVLVFIAIAARLIPGPRTIDDAYITFRYANNLVAGNGFVYNPGERVLGTTTPLFTLILAGIAQFSGETSAPFPVLAMVISAIADSASCVLLFLIGTRLGAKWAAPGAALAWAIAPFSVTFAIGGLETSVYVLLLIAVFWSYLERYYEVSAFLSSLALLTRPDALLLVLPLLADRLVFAPRRGSPHPSWREVLLFLIPGFIWGAFAWSYFGSPFPHSVLAKSAAYRLPQFAALIRFLQHYATPFLEHLSFGLVWIGAGVILYAFLSVVGLRLAAKQNPATWPFFVFPWLYLAVFAAANPLMFRWYLTTPLPFYFLAILLGLEHILIQVFDWLQSHAQFPQRFGRITLFGLVVLSPVLLQLKGWARITTDGLTVIAPEMSFIGVELLYKKVANQLLPHIDSDTSIAAGDVGALGYFTNTRILDLVGLISPETSNYFPLPREQYGGFVYAVPTELILDQLPDYVVILEIYGRHGLLKSEEFLARYDLIETLDTNLYESENLLVYQLK